MRRVLAGVTAAVVATAVSGLVLLGGGASSSAAAPTIQLTLSPPAGQTHVKDNPDKVHFSGQVTPGAAITAAAVHFYNAQGVEFRAKMNVYNDLNYDRPSGTIAGAERTLPGMAGGHDGYIVFRVTAVDPTDGEQGTGDSNHVPIDLMPPYINTTRLTAPNTIQVVFSEPVHLPTQSDSQADWGVEISTFHDPVQNRDEIVYQTPTGISRSGEIITLTTAKTYDEDDTPQVRYNAGAGLLPDRENYYDDSANNAYDTGSYQTSEDKIAPQPPTITQVEGTQGTSGVGKSPTPVFQFSNLRAGHHVELYRDANGDSVFQRPGDAFAGEAVATGSGAQITAPDLISDGTYKFFAIARDNALCDPPDDGGGDEALCPNRSSNATAATATYVLDRIVPTIQFAAVTDVAEVTVGFTEEVFGQNNPANWQVSGAAQVTAVTGSGNRRTLTVVGAQPGANITYTPGNYADAAGNGVPSFLDLLLNNLPPIVNVTDPVGTVHVRDASYEFKGTADRADEVRIFRNDDNNSTPDSEEPIATAGVTGGTWNANVPLQADRDNLFIVRGIKFASGTTPQIIGQNQRVEGLVLKQDSQDPTLTLGALPGTAFRGEDVNGVAINWTANDANFPTSPGPIDIEYSLDGGTTWEFATSTDRGTLGDGYQNDPPFDWFPPLANTTSAQIKVTASDLAGRSTSKTSPLFELDSTKPFFSAVILTARTVELTFSEPVDGVLTPSEWAINGETVGQVEPVGPVSGQTSAKLTQAPTAPAMDPAQLNLIRYEPLLAERVSQKDLHDHVGNPIVSETTGGGAGGGGDNGNGGATAIATPVSACTIFGTEGADVITGTEGQDIICPSNGDDHINALGGNDIILPGLGNKTIDGGTGSDEINGGPDNDTLIGGSGSDLLVGSTGTDSLLGGDGDDMILGDDGADSIDGGSGLDVIEGNDGDDDITTGAGIDIVSGGGDDDTISGGDDNDRLAGDAGNDALHGGDGDDALEGGDGNDTLQGEAGDDELLGGEGKDQLLGDGGNDRITAGEGNDRLSGDAGNDRLEGDKGDDRIDGGDGNDNLFGSEGKDTMLGQDGNDKLLGSDDNDTMYGGDGRDQLSGESGRDRLLGGNQRDKILGGSGRDRLDGGEGGDFCDGGTAPDSKISCEGGPST